MEKNLNCKILTILKKEAKSSETSTERLIELSEQDVLLARLAARNTNATEKLLIQLSSHSDKFVRKWVCLHANITPNLLEKLGDEFPQHLLSNPALNNFIIKHQVECIH